VPFIYMLHGWLPWQRRKARMQQQRVRAASAVCLRTDSYRIGICSALRTPYMCLPQLYPRFCLQIPAFTVRKALSHRQVAVENEGPE